MRIRNASIGLGLAIASAVAPLDAQVVPEPLNLDAAVRIRREGLDRSRVDELAGDLLDVVGPRLTGSEGIRRAREWAAAHFREWGLTDVRIEPWDSLFGRGWEPLSATANSLEPFRAPLVVVPRAWSGSTLGTVRCPVVALAIADTAEIARWNGRLRGLCVLRGEPPAVPSPESESPPRRLRADQVRSSPPAAGTPSVPPDATERLQRQARVGEWFVRWIRNQKPAAILQPSRSPYLVLGAGEHMDSRLARDSAYEPSVQLVVALEQYARLWRSAQLGASVLLELDVRNRFLDEDRRGYNTTAEIRGSALPHEVVLVGAHLDSWHGGTGAVDNGAGVVVVMEAIRILRAVGTPLRRTVRVALWEGEEQGLLGSRAWVRMHREELPRISVYLNVDRGTGRIRGITGRDPDAAAVVSQVVGPLADLRVVGAHRGVVGASDHLSFGGAGVPAFEFVQDPLDYWRAYHSNTDTFERLNTEDLRQATIVVAWTAFCLANREQMLPRASR